MLILAFSDTQWAYLVGIRDFVLNKKDYILTQVGNPEGEDKPNKKVTISHQLSCAEAESDDSTTIHEIGFVKVRRPFRPVSRKLAQILATLVSYLLLPVGVQGSDFSIADRL
jgi:hypothetical protein